jgi:hypothetical protein
MNRPDTGTPAGNGARASERDIPDFALERFRLGELPEDAVARVRRRAAVDAAVAERLAALDRSDAFELKKTTPKEFAAAVRARVAEAGWADGRAGAQTLVNARARRGTFLAASLVLALAGVVVRNAGTFEEGDRPKGAPSEVVLFRRIPGDGFERLTPDSRARAGDVVQVAYRVTDDGYGAIFSIDGRGVVTRHFPVSGNEAGPLRVGGTVPLEAAFRLDDAPRLERFYFVTSRAPFPLDGVVAALRAAPSADALSRLPLDSSFGQASFLLKKE